MTSRAPDTEELLAQAAAGQGQARADLLARHRQRLRKMVAYRLDRRMAARIDPSDVVQEVLAEANLKLDRYLQERPLPFYPWLRELAAEHMVTLHRRHVQAARRSVQREEPGLMELPDESLANLAERLVSATTSPSHRLMRKEKQHSVRQALNRLPQRDREVLILRHLEQLSVADTAAALGISQGAVKQRHVRALERLRSFLKENDASGEPQ